MAFGSRHNVTVLLLCEQTGSGVDMREVNIEIRTPEHREHISVRQEGTLDMSKQASQYDDRLQAEPCLGKDHRTQATFQ